MKRKKLWLIIIILSGLGLLLSFSYIFCQENMPPDKIEVTQPEEASKVKPKETEAQPVSVIELILSPAQPEFPTPS